MNWHLKELIGRYESESGSPLTYREISEETGISTNTITLIARNKSRRADLDTINTLLEYFSRKLDTKLQTGDLLRFNLSGE
jgi:transcriptional regulator with XRE-family HTH domain